MKKEIEKKNILTAEEIKDSLSKELDLFVKGLPINAKLKSLEDDLAKVQSLIEIQHKQIRDYEQKITSIQLQINASSVEDLPALSKQKAKITVGKAEGEILLNDLSSRKKDIEAALKKINDSLQHEILQFLRVRCKSFEKEISNLIHDKVEPKLSGWEAFAFEAVRRFGFDLSKFMVELEIKVYAPLIEAACQNVMSNAGK